jgi:hypothetical protein
LIGGTIARQSNYHLLQKAETSEVELMATGSAKVVIHTAGGEEVESLTALRIHTMRHTANMVEAVECLMVLEVTMALHVAQVGKQKMADKTAIETAEARVPLFHHLLEKVRGTHCR